MYVYMYIRFVNKDKNVWIETEETLIVITSGAWV